MHHEYGRLTLATAGLLFSSGDDFVIERFAFCSLSVISEQEFYGSRTSSAHELCSGRRRRISDADGDNATTVAAATYHSSTHSAQNNAAANADHSAHAKLTYMSSLSAPDVHQVTEACCFFTM